MRLPYDRIPYDVVIDEAIHFGATHGVYAVNMEVVSKNLAFRCATITTHWEHSEDLFLCEVRRTSMERLREDFTSRLSPSKEKDPVEIVLRMLQTARALRDETLFLISDYQTRHHINPDPIDLPDPLNEYIQYTINLFDTHEEKFEVYNHEKNQAFFPFIRDIFLDNFLGICAQVAQGKPRPTHELAQMAYSSLSSACFGGKECLVKLESNRKLARFNHPVEPNKED
jgi:hypothetical protein